MDKVDVHVEVEVNPTEDLENVKRAVENIFGSVEFEVKPKGWGSLLTAKTKGIDGLTKFHNLLRRHNQSHLSKGNWLYDIPQDF